jgi:RNase P subunit RPR2
MPLTGRGHSSLERTNGRPLCPQCRAPLWSVRVQPEKTADDARTFQCPRCEYSHIEGHDDNGAQSKPLRVLHRGSL